VRDADRAGFFFIGIEERDTVIDGVAMVGGADQVIAGKRQGLAGNWALDALVEWLVEHGASFHRGRRLRHSGIGALVLKFQLDLPDPVLRAYPVPSSQNSERCARRISVLPAINARVTPALIRLAKT
jgi:hypothetical protein